MMQILADMEQGSREWLDARCGLVTASRFAAVLAKTGKTRRDYLLQLAAERISGELTRNYENAHMRRGHELEPEARESYEFLTDNEATLVGFIRNGDVGYSPDFLVGDQGLGEVKTRLPALQLDVLLRDEFPSEYWAQCQGGLWIAEREWIDLVCYWPGLPVFIKRAYRDEAFIERLACEVSAFNEELASIVEQINSRGA